MTNLTTAPLTNGANGFSPFFVIDGVNFLIPARGDFFSTASVRQALTDVAAIS